MKSDKDKQLEGIVEFCKQCICSRESKAVRECTAIAGDCALWPYRTGKLSKSKTAIAQRKRRGFKVISPKKAIRDECRICMGNNSNEVDDCRSDECPLWKHRGD